MMNHKKGRVRAYNSGTHSPIVVWRCRLFLPQITPRSTTSGATSLITAIVISTFWVEVACTQNLRLNLKRYNFNLRLDIFFLFYHICFLPYLTITFFPFTIYIPPFSIAVTRRPMRS